MSRYVKITKKYLSYFLRKLRASRANAYAAQTAFFMFLSLIPLIMLLLSLLKQFGSEAILTSGITQFTPNIIDSFLDMYLSEIMDDSKLSLTIASAIILLWSASKGVFAIIGGLNSVYEIKENRNYFYLRILAILYTISFILILSAVLMLLVFGDKLNDLLFTLMPNLQGLVFIISSLRFIITFVFLVLFFCLLYKALPNEKMSFSDQIPGAVISAAGWIIFSMLFSFFVDNFSHYANIYGSLSAIIILMLWMYICIYIVFIGAEINLILSNKFKKEDLDS
ncbi:MAG: YihY/virulence factor BrkB family protein [Clostridia bacterium]|nr:YihY/virulence factor BrkB family protein [Clostridia bacterium]